jgi:hypothetical protein
MKPKTRARRRFINWRWYYTRMKAGRLYDNTLTPTYLENMSINLWPVNGTPSSFPIEKRLYHG